MSHTLRGHRTRLHPVICSCLLAFTVIAAGPRPLSANTARDSKRFISQCEDRTQRKRYKGDYAGALAAVEECLRSAPGSGDLLFLRASIMHARDNLEQALAIYRQALAAGLDRASERKVRTIIEDLAPIENTGIRIEVGNGPANIYLVSKSLGVRCVAAPACTIGRLPGRVQVYVEREGFSPIRKRIEVTGSRITTVTLELDELPSRLDMDITPRDAAVMFDKQRVVDVSRPLDMAPGEHRLRVELDGYAPHEQVITAHHGQPVRVRVALAELVRVNVSVPGARLFVDGKPATFEHGLVRLPAGPRRAHVVTATAPGYFETSAEIPRERQRHHEVDLDLDKRQALPPAPPMPRLLAGPPPPPPPLPQRQSGPGWSRAKIAAVATTGTLAAAGYAVTAGLAIDAAMLRNEVAERCARDGAPGVVCDEEGLAAMEIVRARSAAAQVSAALGTVAAAGMLASIHWNEPATEHGGMSWNRKLSIAGSTVVAVAASGAGLRFTMRSQASNDQALACSDDPSCSWRIEHVLSTQADDDARVAKLGFAVAGTAAVSAVFLWLTAPSGNDEHAEPPVQIAPVLGQSQVGITIAGTLP